jgi:L,D-transpeptidase-like protein
MLSGKLLWGLLGATVIVAATSTFVVASTLGVRYERDVARMVFNDNVQLLDELRHRIGLERDSLSHLLAASPEPSADKPYIVVSIEDRRLWYRKGDSLLFTAEVATGSGKVLERSGEGAFWRFETPRGRLSVVSKETDPVWVPPDWHYVEQAQERGLGIVRLKRGERIPAPDGEISVAGSDVVKRSADGRLLALAASDDNQIVAGGNIVIPPFGTNQRKYKGVLGTHRLNLGDGYAIHGTNRPETVGRAVSHGCVRLRNEDIATLYDLVPVGAPVFIY